MFSNALRMPILRDDADLGLFASRLCHAPNLRSQALKESVRFVVAPKMAFLTHIAADMGKEPRFRTHEIGLMGRGSSLFSCISLCAHIQE
jgi:hypothetical protein